MTTFNRYVLPKLALAFALGATNDPAAAHETQACEGASVRWAAAGCTFRVDNHPLAGPFRSAFFRAMAAWNRTPADFTFSMIRDRWFDPMLGNMQNEAWMTDDDDLLDGAMGVCFSWRECAVRTEADIVFDSRVQWTTGMSSAVMSAYGGNAAPFGAVAIHELGHALGLRHEADSYNVMGAATRHLHTNGSTSRPYVGEDGTHGAIFLYGMDGSQAQDVAVSHWRHTGSWSGYSTHGRTRLFVNGVPAMRFGFGAEPVYQVRRGQLVDMEMTYENNGSSSQQSLLRFYVSTNNYISSSDQYLGAATVTVNRNQVYTTRHRLRVPSNLQVGRAYWLGVKIDAAGQISEFDESNNATYIGIRVMP